jgi:hypothetical protein
MNSTSSERPRTGSPVPAHPPKGGTAGKQPTRTPGGIPNFHPSNVQVIRRGKLLCVCDLAIDFPAFGRLTLIDLRLIKDGDAPPYVLPCQSVWNDEATGERRFKGLAVFPHTWRPALNAAVRAAYEAAIQKAEAQEGDV